MIGGSVTEDSMVEETTCDDCQAKIEVYSAMTGLLPAEYVRGRRATHSWLVCELRQQINALLKSVETKT